MGRRNSSLLGQEPEGHRYAQSAMSPTALLSSQVRSFSPNVHKVDDIFRSTYFETYLLAQ